MAAKYAELENFHDFYCCLTDKQCLRGRNANQLKRVKHNSLENPFVQVVFYSTELERRLLKELISINFFVRNLTGLVKVLVSFSLFTSISVDARTAYLEIARLKTLLKPSRVSSPFNKLHFQNVKPF